MTGVAEANPELLSARNILYGVWKSAYDPPVWFIKTLFELILISPLVWGIANKLKQKTVVLVIFIALSVIGFTPGYTSILFWIPLYLLAATIACCKNDMISHFSMTRSYLCVVLYCSFIAYKDITSLEFVENIFRLMNWNRECRYKVLGRVANSDQGLCMLFDLEEAIMFTPKPQEYTDPLTGEMKKKQMKFFPDAYKNRIGKSYNDYIADHQMNMFEDFIGYQGSAVLDEPEQKTDTISVLIPQCEESENIPLSDFPEQPENVQRPGSEVVEKGMLT